MEKEQVTYVSEAIGDDYKKWDYNKTIFIKTPTGSGKTTFIFKNLLKHVMHNKGKILYLVNRKILEKQLQEELEDIANEYDLYINIKDYIYISTYQKIENLLATNSYEIKRFYGFTFVVYDECHYFFCDAAFNTLTELSYDFLRNTYCKCVQIFLSATMDNIFPILQKRKEIYLGTDTEYRVLNKKFTYDNIKSDYSYININLLQDKNDLLKRILDNLENENEKWLIFVDSISYGNKLYEEIKNYDKNTNNKNEDKEVLFIDARFKNNSENKEEVNTIVKEKRSKKILITTSVMDNGISLEDEYLRNIVIMADTKETFIQMLGRKRIKNNNEKLNLYILKREIAYFDKRIDNIKDILKFYNKNKYDYEKIIKNNIYNLILKFPDKNKSNILSLNNVNETNAYRTLITLLQEPYMFHCIGFIKNPNIQQKLLNHLLNNSVKYEKIYKKLFYSYAGTLEFNSFSIEYYKYLKNIYQDIIDNLKEDEYYFIKKQLSWLGLEKNDEQIRQLFNNLDENHKNHLIETLDNVIEKELSSDENKELKIQIRDDLKYFLKKCKL